MILPSLLFESLFNTAELWSLLKLIKLCSCSRSHRQFINEWAYACSNITLSEEAVATFVSWFVDSRVESQITVISFLNIKCI
jgi:hypothetical protein